MHSKKEESEDKTRAKNEKRDYPIFTKEMKKDYTILVPTMLPRHFKIMIEILKSYGYNAELLENMGDSVITEGL